MVPGSTTAIGRDVVAALRRTASRQRGASRGATAIGWKPPSLPSARVRPESSHLTLFSLVK
jgi:hypothetical protein